MSRSRSVVLALLAVLLGCASVPAAERAKAKKKDCINTREINVMRALDDKHVFVKVGAGRYYLFTMESRCRDLHLARNLQVFEASSRVCDDGVTLLAFELPTVGAMRCRVTKLDPVRDLDAANELIASEVPPKEQP
jgi:uncharacterized protein DUF6491